MDRIPRTMRAMLAEMGRPGVSEERRWEMLAKFLEELAAGDGCDLDCEVEVPYEQEPVELPERPVRRCGWMKKLFE